MKKAVRVITLVLVLSMLLCSTVFAVDVTNISGTVTFNDVEQTQMKAVCKNDAITKDGMYLTLIVRGTKDAYTIDQNSILYIDQFAGDNGSLADKSITFNNLYPSAIEDSVVLLTGTGLGATPVVLAEIEVPAPAFKKGDIDNDGDISSLDAIAMNQHLAGLPGCALEKDSVAYFAADIDGDGDISSLDAIALNQYLAFGKEL